MMTALLGGAIGLFFGFIISVFLYCRFDSSIPKIFFANTTITKEEAKRFVWLNKIFAIALCLLITNTCSFGAVQMSKEETRKYIEEYLAVKTTIESSVQNEALSGLERIELVKQASEENVKLARIQYKCKQWYGFDIDKRVLELEPIKL